MNVYVQIYLLHTKWVAFAIGDWGDGRMAIDENPWRAIGEAISQLLC